MPVSASIWTVTPSGTYVTGIRTNLDNFIGQQLDYIATIDGAWTLGAAELAFRTDQSMADAISSILTSTAPRAVLAARLMDIGSEPRPATKTRVTVFKNGIGILPLGTVLQTLSTINPVFGNTVQDPRGQWTVVDNDSNNAADLAEMVLESNVAGEVTCVSPVAIFTFVTPVPPLVNCEYDEGAGSTTTLGRNAESTPELRTRLSADRVANGGSIPAIRQAVLNLDWIVACAITGSAGVTSVTVAPAPSGTDQRVELAETLLDIGPPGEWAGPESETITGPDGSPVTIYWTNGTTENVAVAWTSLVLDGTVPLAEVEAAIEANIRAVFALLAVGETVRYQRVYAATVTAGLLGLSLTIDGGVVDVSPTTSADILVPTF